MVGKMKNMFFNVPTISFLFRFEQQFLTTYCRQIEEKAFFNLPTISCFFVFKNISEQPMVDKLKTKFFICPPLVILFRFPTRFLTTYGGQIEEKAFVSICPPLVVFLFVLKSNSWQPMVGKLKKRCFFNLPTISCFYRCQKPFLTTYGGQIEGLLFSICQPLVVVFRFETHFPTTYGGQIEEQLFLFILATVSFCFVFKNTS